MSSIKYTRIWHIIPSLNIGGVEVAIHRSHSELNTEANYEVFSIKGKGTLAVPRISRGAMLRRLLLRREKPELIVSSLWLGHLFAYIVKHLFNCPWVAFFHNAKSEGAWRDAILKFAAKRSDHQFHDSDATRAYYGKFAAESSTIVPYRFIPPTTPSTLASSRTIDICYAGRISQQKRPDLIIGFISALTKRHNQLQALLMISGSDDEIEAFANELLAQAPNCQILRNVPPDQVYRHLKSSRFYLTVSDYEGFSMATVDAIQCGCVPIVRPVGELARYVDDSMGIILRSVDGSSLNEYADHVVSLLHKPEDIQVLSDRALTQMDAYPTYCSSFLGGVKTVLRHS